MKQNDLIKIMVTKRNHKTKDGKRNFPIYRTKMNLVVKGQEEKGKQLKWVTVKFIKELDVKEISYGLITVKVADVSFPRVYEITENENGEKEYPVVWIRGFIEFHPIERDVENPFVTDESETDETEIPTEELENIPFDTVEK